jgi:O-antigen/teichoic acid export membrane protein
MGIVQRQATITTAVTYIGIALGFISTVFVYPRVFTPDENGLFKILVSVSLIYAQFSSFGIQNAIIRIFPHFKNEEKNHHGFILIPFLVTLVGFGLCSIVYFLSKDWLISKNIEKSKLFVDYMFLILPLTFFSAFFSVLDNYARALFDSVSGALSKEVLQRILILLVAILYYFEVISIYNAIIGYVAANCIPTVILFITQSYQGHISFNYEKNIFTKSLIKETIWVSAFSIVTNFSSNIISVVDSILINDKLGLAQTGIYAITFYVGSSIIIPGRAINRIAGPVVLKYFREQDMKGLEEFYKKSSSTQILLGLILFIGIWVNIDDLLLFFPEEYKAGKYVILFIGLGNLLDMSTGVNAQVIYASKFYKVDAFFMFVLVLSTIGFNYWLIPEFGIVGSAVASCISLGILNFMRVAVIKWQLGFLPFSLNFLKIVLIALIIFTSIAYIQFNSNYIINILIKGTLVVLAWLAAIWRFNISEDMKKMMIGLINKTPLKKFNS